MDPNLDERSRLEFELKERELKLREDEFAHRREIDSRTSRLNVSPATTALVAGALSLLAGVVTGSVSGCWSLNLKEREQEFQIILKATENRTPDEAAQNLKFFVDIGYLNDPDSLISMKASAGEVPVITTGRTPNPIEERIKEQIDSSAGEGSSSEVTETVETDLSDGEVPIGPLSIRNHVLVGPSGRFVPVFGATSLSKLQELRLIVIHFTVNGSLKGTVNWMRRDDARNSAHVFVDRTGAIAQMVPFDYASHHAGQGVWKGMTSVNKFSVGIDLINWGTLERSEKGWSPPIARGIAVPDSEVYRETVPNSDGAKAWHAFSEAQIRQTIEVCRALVKAYPTITEIVGHRDVDPRKSRLDPGPAFPMERVRREVFGR